jgi:hypothetical protein
LAPAIDRRHNHLKIDEREHDGGYFDKRLPVDRLIQAFLIMIADFGKALLLPKAVTVCIAQVAV